MYKAILIDDEPLARQLVRAFLKGYEQVEVLAECSDGFEGFKAIQDHQPDLIFLDINMPQHDGFSWLKGIRESGYEDLPIIMYTNSLRPDHIMQAYKGGANLYYAKPTSFNELIKGLRKIISLDWDDPISITEAYSHNGQYSIFKVA